MILNNPQDLAPILAAMRAELKGDLDTLAQRVQTSNAELAQTVSTDTQNVIDGVNALSVVNGEINSEVKAINAHTSAELENVKTSLTSDSAASESRLKTQINAKSAIKSVHRVSSNGQRTFKIPAVNTAKTVVNVTSQTIGTAYCYAYLQSSTELVTRMHGASTPINVEVIEYA